MHPNSNFKFSHILACAIIFAHAASSLAAPDEPVAPGQGAEIRQSEPEASPPTPAHFCQALATAATANDLPVQWTNGQNVSLSLPPAKDRPCDLGPGAPIAAGLPTQQAATHKPWGVEVVGGPTGAKALDRYREWLPKYAAIIGPGEPKVVVVGVIGQMGAVHIRVATDTRAEADKVCAQLHAAGAYCEVWRD